MSHTFTKSVERVARDGGWLSPVQAIRSQVGVPLE